MNAERFKPLKQNSLYLVSSEGYLLNTKTGYKNYGTIKKTGYSEIQINHKYYLIHRLIAETFCEKHNENCEVNHINGNKTDNKAINLEWISHKENLKHAYINHLRNDDVSPRKVKGTNIETGEQMCFDSIYKAAKFLNISQGNICSCCKGIRPSASGYIWEYEE